MGQIYLFSNQPNIHMFPYYPTPYLDLDGVRRRSVMRWRGEVYQVPLGREECLDQIIAALSGMRDSGTWNLLSALPYIPWNFTNPCISDAAGAKAASVAPDWWFWGGDRLFEKTLLIPIGPVSIQYSEPNGAGTLSCLLHPDSPFPAAGDYITAVWDDGSGVKPQKPMAATDVFGVQVFYGRVTKSQKTAAGIQVTAVDAIGVLLDSGQFSVGKLNALDAIYNIALKAGVYMYLSNDHGSAVLQLPKTPISRVYSGTYLSGINDLLDRWYLETGSRQFLTAYGGLIEIASYDDALEMDVIDARMMKKWTFEQNTEHVYTRTYITYPVIETKTSAKGVSTTITVQKVYRDEASNMVFRHSRYHTFRYTAESWEHAVAMSALVLANHSMPTFTIAMDEVVGMPHLRPGMNVAVPVVRDIDDQKLVAVSRVRAVTHNFAADKYTMDVVVECDPYNRIYDRLGRAMDIQVEEWYGMDHPEHTPSYWAEGITVSYFETGKQFAVRSKDEKRIQASLTPSTRREYYQSRW